ncbi:Plant-specific TFIIB-related protein PTF2 [Bienertia sinuspersici]
MKSQVEQYAHLVALSKILKIINTLFVEFLALKVPLFVWELPVLALLTLTRNENSAIQKGRLRILHLVSASAMLELERVVDSLGLELKEFDLVGLLEKTFRRFTGFSEVDKEKIDMMGGDQDLLLAVLVFVGAVNGIEEVAKEMNVAIRTCKLRYKELLEAMVEVAKKLPWGKEVNIKNIVKNAPSLLKYMEMKSLEERQIGYGGFDGGAQNSVRCLDGLQRLENLKVAHEELAKVYSKFKAEFSNRRPMNENDSVGYGDRLSGLGFQLIDEWWDGRSELCEKLLMEQLLEKDVGLDALPPSYVRGCLAVKRRQEKIRAAKVRINSIVNPATSISSNVSVQSGLGAQFCSSDDSGTVVNVYGRKKRKKRNNNIDWEDFIIETLLLHQVREEEIEKGHYNALLGLQVFKSGLV